MTSCLLDVPTERSGRLDAYFVASGATCRTVRKVLPAAGSDVDAAAISPFTLQGEPVIGITKAPDRLSELVMPSTEAHPGLEDHDRNIGICPGVHLHRC